MRALRIANGSPPVLLPGGGRGPIGMTEVMTCRALSRLSPNWAPAFAGVVAVVGTGEEAL